MPRYDGRGTPEAPYLYKRPVRFDEFAQRVRRYRPSQLLPAIARLAIEMEDIDRYMREMYRVVTPWALATAAKVSIAAGNEHRPSSTITDDDVMKICAAFTAVNEPLHEPEALNGDPASFFIRVANEQFAWQVRPAPEVSRTHALYVDGLPDTATTMIDAALLEDLLGCSVAHYIGAGFLLWAAARSNGGWYEPRFLRGPEAQEIFDIVPEEVIELVLTEHFATTFDEFRNELADPRHAVPPRFERHQYNPLVARPFIQMAPDRWLAPQPTLIVRKLGPDAIYYAGGARYGNAFTDDVGLLLETYVRRQLAQIPDAQIIDEIDYDNSQRSVDFFIVWPELVVLVEVKSARLTQGARIGLADLEVKLQSAIGKAFSQIKRSSDLIQAGHPAFSAIPTDRPHVALFVTLESYWVGNSKMVRRLVDTPEPMPTSVVTLRELEHLIALSLDGGGAALLSEVLADDELKTWGLLSALRNKRPNDDATNPLLDAVWDGLPWSDPPMSAATES